MHLLAGQSPSRPAVGQRVRIHVTTSELRVGKVAGWLEDTLVLRQLVYRGSPDSLLYIPRADIESYQASLGRDEGRGAGRGAKLGTLVGGGIGLVLLGLGLYSDSQCEEYCFGTLIGAVLGAGSTLAGFLVGATIGLVAAPERWSEPRSVATRELRSRSPQFALRLSIGR
jgi:hypothetical protein